MNDVFVSGILLAAGLSRRLNGTKLFLKIGAKTVFEQSLDNLLKSTVDEVIVVLGNRAGELQSLIGNKPVKVVYNSEFSRGMSTSLKAGLGAADSAAGGYIFSLADQPFVDSGTTNSMVKIYKTTDKGIVVPVYHGKRGNPVIFSKKYRDAILKLEGDAGAREILKNNPDDVFELESDSAAILIDIDTPSDYQNALISAGLNLKSAFALSDREIISIVGGGGKTSLMFALAGELAATGVKVITTTTTKIWPPAPAQSPLTILNNDRSELLENARTALKLHNHITLSREKLENGKLNGINPEWVPDLSGLCDYLIIEADGAAQHPIKAPNDTEPVIPDITTLVIPVIGLDAIGEKAVEETVFRLPLFLKVTGLNAGDNIDDRAAVKLLTGQDGIIKNTPASARIVPLLNKTDTSGGLEKGKSLAAAVLTSHHPQINRVVLGQVMKMPPVVEVITR